MSATLGYIALITAMALGLSGMVMGLIPKGTHYLSTQQKMTFAIFGLLTLAMLLLVHSFLSDDFSVKYVAEHSNRALPFFYKLTASGEHWMAPYYCGFGF